MKKILFHCFLASVLFTVISCRKNNTGSPDNPVNPDSTKYANGFFVLHWGLDSAEKDIDFYNYDKDSLFRLVYKKENPGISFGKDFGKLAYGTIYKNRFYMITTRNGYVVVANPLTLKETGRIESTTTLDAHAFLGINDSLGLLSCGDGIYRMSLLKPELGAKISGIDGFVGEMVKAGNYIFVYSELYGVVVLNPQDLSIVKKIGQAVGGLIVSKDGSVWALGRTDIYSPINYLIRINPVTLNSDFVQTPFDINHRSSSSLGFRKCSIAASTKENVIYLTSWIRTYRYVIGDPTSLNAPIFSLAIDEIFQGSGVNYDAEKNKLIILALVNTYPSYKNKLYFCNPITGALEKTITYSKEADQYMVVFH